MSFARSSHSNFCAALLLTSTLLFAGCGNNAPKAIPVSVTGNWQISSTATAALKLPALSGSFSGTTAALTGILHSDSLAACIPPTTAIAVSGSTNGKGITTVTGHSLANGTLTLSGTLAADAKSFTDATYTVSGGSCAFAAPAIATAEVFSPISGSYNGTFSDVDGPVLTLTGAILTQSPTSNADGNFTLSGSATFNNPCFSNSVSVSNTQVTGGNFTLTYADPNTMNSVVVSGTFSQDGTTLTVTDWTLTGSCGPDSGTGLLTKQQPA
jgi:hypothetical protein